MEQRESLEKPLLFFFVNSRCYLFAKGDPSRLFAAWNLRGNMYSESFSKIITYTYACLPVLFHTAHFLCGTRRNAHQRDEMTSTSRRRSHIALLTGNSLLLSQRSRSNAYRRFVTNGKQTGRRSPLGV